jgi:GMP synthase (glutamine-hydrolysing)
LQNICQIIEGFPKKNDALLGHKEAYDATPEGATLLMTRNNCPLQILRVGENMYATQFHPEDDAELFALRIDSYANHGYFESHEAEALKEETSRKTTLYAQVILR